MMKEQTEGTNYLASKIQRIGNKDMASSPKGDIFARFMGFLVLLGGLAIIGVVLWSGYLMYQDPNLGLTATTPSKNGSVDTVKLGIGFGQLIVKIILLFFGSICGSLIANKGVQLYFAGVKGKSDREGI